MKFTAPQFTMNAGIYSPELAEREDTEAYYASVRDVLNMRPKPEGGAELRPALTYAQLMRGPMLLISLEDVDYTLGDGVSLTEDGGTEAPAPGGPVVDPPPYPGYDDGNYDFGPFFGVYA